MGRMIELNCGGADIGFTNSNICAAFGRFMAQTPREIRILLSPVCAFAEKQKQH